MDGQELITKWIRVFAKRYSEGIYFPGREDYYGFDVYLDSSDGARIELHATFKAGERYCCFEYGCHFGSWGPNDWARLRQSMREEGLDHLGRVTLRLRVTVQNGAMDGLRYPGDSRQLRPREAFSYRAGPFVEPAAAARGGQYGTPFPGKDELYEVDGGPGD